jgi:hypothetical protein
MQTAISTSTILKAFFRSGGHEFFKRFWAELAAAQREEAAKQAETARRAALQDQLDVERWEGEGGATLDGPQMR